ncbi:unnamed protein product, partial [Closterium sp. NIES-53]
PSAASGFLFNKTLPSFLQLIMSALPRSSATCLSPVLSSVRALVATRHAHEQYACRKNLADSRPRVRGRFARNDEIEEGFARSSHLPFPSLTPTHPRPKQHEQQDKDSHSGDGADADGACADADVDISGPHGTSSHDILPTSHADMFSAEDFSDMLLDGPFGSDVFFDIDPPAGRSST